MKRKTVFACDVAFHTSTPSCHRLLLLLAYLSATTTRCLYLEAVKLSRSPVLQSSEALSEDSYYSEMPYSDVSNDSPMPKASLYSFPEVVQSTKLFKETGWEGTGEEVAKHLNFLQMGVDSDLMGDDDYAEPESEEDNHEKQKYHESEEHHDSAESEASNHNECDHCRGDEERQRHHGDGPPDLKSESTNEVQSESAPQVHIIQEKGAAAKATKASKAEEPSNETAQGGAKRIPKKLDSIADVVAGVEGLKALSSLGCESLTKLVSSRSAPSADEKEALTKLKSLCSRSSQTFATVDKALVAIAASVSYEKINVPAQLELNSKDPIEAVSVVQEKLETLTKKVEKASEHIDRDLYSAGLDKLANAFKELILAAGDCATQEAHALKGLLMAMQATSGKIA